MSRCSWIALLLALVQALGGCKPDGDDDASSVDDDDETAGDDDVVGDDDVQDDDDDDDFEPGSVVRTFVPSVIYFGETPSFVMTGEWLGSVFFWDEPSWTAVYVEHYTDTGLERVEGIIPGGLWVGVFDACTDADLFGEDCLPGGLEVLPLPGDDDDSAGDDDDSS